MEILCTFVILDKYHQFALYRGCTCFPRLTNNDGDLCKSEGWKMSSLCSFNLHFSYMGKVENLSICFRSHLCSFFCVSWLIVIYYYDRKTGSYTWGKSSLCQWVANNSFPSLLFVFQLCGSLCHAETFNFYFTELSLWIWDCEL